MAAPKSLIVEDLTSLWGLSNLSEDDFGALLAEVSEAQPTPRTSTLCDAVTPEYQTLIRALVRVAINLRVDRNEIRDLLTNHVEQITEMPLDRISDEQITRAVDRSLELLNSRPIRFRVLSDNLRRSHEHTFMDAAVVTDLRPIADVGPDTGDPQIIATLRRHNLRLTTLDYELNRQVHFFVLDDEDLTFLISVLRDALELIPALEQLSEQNDLIDLSLS